MQLFFVNLKQKNEKKTVRVTAALCISTLCSFESDRD
jgi:hypothetical protein